MSRSQGPPGSGLPGPVGGTPLPPATSATWGPAQVMGGLAVLLVAMAIAAGIIGSGDPELERLSSRLALQAILAVALIAVAFSLAEAGALGARASALGLGRSLARPWLPALGAYGVYLLCAVVIGVILQPEQEDVTRELGWGQSTLGDVAAVLLVVLAAPLTEEIFFRGFMFAGIRSRAPFALAAAVSAVVWGVFHFTGPDSWPVVLQLTVFGVILAWLYERTGSLRAAIVLHVLNNAVAFALITA